MPAEREKMGGGVDGYVVTEVGTSLPWVGHDGHKRILGCLPPRMGADGRPDLLGIPEWSDTKPTMTDDEQESYLKAHGGIVHLDPDQACGVLDQDGESACVAFATAMAMMVCNFLNHRLGIKLSPAYIYSLINGGRDAGAIITDAGDAMRKVGAATDATVPYGHIYPNRYDVEKARAEAAQNRAEEIYHLKDPNEVRTAIIHRYPVVVGIMVGRRFTVLDAEGVPGVGGFGGHALATVGVALSPRYRFKHPTRNSWSPSYGDKGECNLIDDHFTQQSYFDAFALKSTIVNPTDPNEPPPVA